MFAPLNSAPGPRSTRSPWSPSTSGRSYAVAALRAAIISVVLLCALALLLIF
jgi:hypothetical protein